MSGRMSGGEFLRGSFWGNVQAETLMGEIFQGWGLATVWENVWACLTDRQTNSLLTTVLLA